MLGIRSGPVAAATAITLVAISGVGVAAQDDEKASPVEFTASWKAGGGIVRPMTSTVGEGVEEYRGGAFTPWVISEATDPRLVGHVTLAVNYNDYPARDGLRVVNHAFRVENEDGAWQQLPAINIQWSGEDSLGVVGVFVGEGAYDGLIAVFDNVIDPEAGGTFDLHGFIFEGGVPPAPEPYVSE